MSNTDVYTLGELLTTFRKQSGVRNFSSDMYKTNIAHKNMC
jgi:hypothetical protein